MEIKKINVNGKEVKLYIDEEGKKAVGYDVLPEDDSLGDTQELMLDELKSQILEQTLVMDKDDING